MIKRVLNNLFIFKKVVPVEIPVANHNDNFKDKSAIVSGGSSGIGYAIAEKLVAGGCQVIILGRSENKLKHAANNIGCKYRVLDVSNLGDIDRVVDEIYSTTKPNILVNSAGVNVNEPFGTVTEKGWDSCFNTNVKGTYFLTQAVTNKMKEHRIKILEQLLIIYSKICLFLICLMYGTIFS